MGSKTGEGLIPVGPRLLHVLRGLAGRAVGRIAGDGELHADVAVALGLPLADLVLERGQLLRAGVGVQRDRLADLAPEELVDGQAGLLAEDVPEGAVDPAQGVVEGDPAPEVGRDVGGLPDVLDPVALLADEQRLDVLIDRRGDGQRTLAVRGAADPVEPRLVREHLHDDEVLAPGLGEDRLARR